MHERFKELSRGLYAAFRKLLGGMIRRGIETGEFNPHLDVESIAAVLVGSPDGPFLQACFDPEVNPPRAGDAYMDVFIRSLEKQDLKVKHGGAGA